MNDAFSIKESFSFAWKTFTTRPLFFVIVIAAVLAFVGLTSSVLQPDQGGNILFTLISIGINILVDMGLVAFALRAHDDPKGVSWQNLWAPARIVQYFLANVLVAIIVLIGLVLLIIPGIVAAIALMFVKYLVMDRGLGPIEAVKESWLISKKHLFKLFLLLLALTAFNIAGAIAFLVGLLVTIPVTMLAVVHVYRTLEHDAHEVVPAAA